MSVVLLDIDGTLIDGNDGHARAWVDAAGELGYRLVVATSAQKDEMKGLLKTANIADLIEDAASTDDADRSKPDPDIVKAGLEKSASAPSEAIMLGDTPYDVEAAGRAGVAIVALECGGWRAEELRGAMALYADPAALLRAYEASPSAERAAKAGTSH